MTPTTDQTPQRSSSQTSQPLHPQSSSEDSLAAHAAYSEKLHPGFHKDGEGDASNIDLDLEKQKTRELDEPVDEVHYGFPNQRGAEAVPSRIELERTRSKKRDPDLVTWEGPDDPLNPKNWSMRQKWAATFVVSVFTLISPVSSSMVAPALQSMGRDLKITTDFELDMVLSIFGQYAHYCGILKHYFRNIC